jgi:hypothetical protein
MGYGIDGLTEFFCMIIVLGELLGGLAWQTFPLLSKILTIFM